SYWPLAVDLVRSLLLSLSFGLSALLAALCLVLQFSSTPGERWREPNPVQAIAPAQAGPLLQAAQHIRLTSRPDDPYPYPIPLGEPGPLMPLYSGGLSYPLYCDFNQQGLSAPIIDNQQGYGVA